MFAESILIRAQELEHPPPLNDDACTVTHVDEKNELTGHVVYPTKIDINTYAGVSLVLHGQQKQEIRVKTCSSTWTNQGTHHSTPKDPPKHHRLCHKFNNLCFPSWYVQPWWFFCFPYNHYNVSLTWVSLLVQVCCNCCSYRQCWCICPRFLNFRCPQVHQSILWIWWIWWQTLGQWC